MFGQALLVPSPRVIGLYVASLIKRRVRTFPRGHEWRFQRRCMSAADIGVILSDMGPNITRKYR